MQPKYITISPRTIDMTGQTFGRLTVLGPVERIRGVGIKWLCRCNCGNVVAVLRTNLRKGRTVSCGCFNQDRKTKHGMATTKLHGVWNAIIQRCNNPQDKAYSNYGERGISICSEWQRNFKSFHDHATRLPHYGEKGRSLDRINNALDYQPGNVRWATRKEQQRNRRANRYLTHNGKTQCISAWAEEIDINVATLYRRLEMGWSTEKTLTKPVDISCRHIA